MDNHSKSYKEDAVKPARKRRKHARPAEILDAALPVFARYGFHAASMEEIAARAGVSKGTVFLYFDSKEALFMDAIRRVVEPLLKKSEFALDEWHGTMSSLLRQLVLGWQQLVKSNPVGEVLKLMLTEEGTFPSLVQQGEMLIGRVRRVVSNIIERGIQTGEFRPCDSTATAQILLAPLGIRELHRYSSASFGVTADSDDAYFSAYVDMVSHGLATR